MLRIEDGHSFRRQLELEIEGQKKKGRPKRTWKQQVEEESLKVGLSWEDALCRSKWIIGVFHIVTEWR